MNNGKDLDNINGGNTESSGDICPPKEPDTAPEEGGVQAVESDTAPEEGCVQAAESDTAPEESGSVLRFFRALHDYVEIFAVSVIAVLLIFTFCFRLCRVDGGSMNNTLYHDEMIVTANFFYEPRQGDIVVFHLSNSSYSEPLVKRVIATEGQTLEINMTDRIITVDGEVYEDENAYFDSGSYVIRSEFDERFMFLEGEKLYFRATVPEGKLFVLGDNRNHSTDSRARQVGFVDEDCVLGKAVVRLSPLSWLAE